MNNKTAKIGCSVVTCFHLFLLSTIFMMGEGILFGFRYFDEIIRIFTGIEMIISIVSIVLIFKDKQMGYVFLALSILSTYIIAFGHHMLWWPCEYCRL